MSSRKNNYSFNSSVTKSNLGCDSDIIYIKL